MSYGQPEEYNNVIDNNAIDMVPRWFEMLKELRNGTISYIQLIKREQIRPPVRPVCRRLGVAKLSDIVSEDILYRAIVQVAESQSQGGGRATRDDNNGSTARFLIFLAFTVLFLIDTICNDHKLNPSCNSCHTYILQTTKH